MSRLMKKVQDTVIITDENLIKKYVSLEFFHY